MNEIRPTTLRQLPVDEWEKLKGLPITTVGMPDQNKCIILVAETDTGEIVGTWAVVFATFLEALWVREDYQRKTSVAWRMIQTMKKLLGKWKIDYAYTLIQTPYVMQLAQRVGFEPAEGTLCRLTVPEIK